MSPEFGQYLSLEPLLQEPWFVKGQALRGRGLPVYGYALSNPVHNVDPDGNFAFALPALCLGGGCEAIAVAAAAVAVTSAAAAGCRRSSIDQHLEFSSRPE